MRIARRVADRQPKGSFTKAELHRMQHNSRSSRSSCTASCKAAPAGRAEHEDTRSITDAVAGTWRRWVRPRRHRGQHSSDDQQMTGPERRAGDDVESRRELARRRCVDVAEGEGDSPMGREEACARLRQGKQRFATRGRHDTTCGSMTVRSTLARRCCDGPKAPTSVRPQDCQVPRRDHDRERGPRVTSGCKVRTARDELPSVNYDRKHKTLVSSEMACAGRDD